LKRKTRKRLQDARKQERDRIEHSDDKRPTLPQIDVDLDSNVSYNQTFAYRSSGDNHSDYSSEHGYGHQQQYSQVSYNNQSGYNVPAGYTNQASYNNLQPYYQDGQSRYSPNRYSQYPQSTISYSTQGAGPCNPSHQAPAPSHGYYQRRGNQGYEATRPAANRSDSDLTS
jgi:hypothetical protein